MKTITMHKSLVSGVRRLGARAYLVLAFIFSLLVAADQLGWLNLLGRAEARLFDALINHRLIAPVPDPDIVIVDIDEASLAGMASKHGRWPWPNQVLGELVQGIEKQKPQAIVFDILFSDSDVLRPESDEAFNAVIAQSGTTFFPMLRLAPHNDHLSRIPIGAIPGVRAVSDSADPMNPVAIILPKLVAALDNGRLGTHQVVPDKDGVIRRYPVWTEHGGWALPSLPQRIAEEFQFPGGDGSDVLLNWRGPPFTYKYVSFIDIYRDLMSDIRRRPADEFRGKIVIIGSTAPSLFDVKGTPMARIHPGVEILATGIDNFKHGDNLREVPAWVMRIVALILIWSMAIALYRQIEIGVFDRLFGILQGGILVVAFVVLNAIPLYLDASAPLSLGLMYFTIARVYHGVALKWLASSSTHDLRSMETGTRVLAVMAIRLKGASLPERRLMKGILGRLVAKSRHGAGRIANLVEDPGFVQGLFSDLMLVYWLNEESSIDWREDARAIENELRRSLRPKQFEGRLRIAHEDAILSWNVADGWTDEAVQLILSAMRKTAAEH